MSGMEAVSASRRVFLRLRRNSSKPNTRSTTRIIPPTTPPAIAPALLELDGELTSVEVEVLADGEVLVEVKILTPPFVVGL